MQNAVKMSKEHVKCIFSRLMLLRQVRPVLLVGLLQEHGSNRIQSKRQGPPGKTERGFQEEHPMQQIANPAFVECNDLPPFHNVVRTHQKAHLKVGQISCFLDHNQATTSGMHTVQWRVPSLGKSRVFLEPSLRSYAFTLITLFSHKHHVCSSSKL